MLTKAELLQIGWQSARNCGRELMASTDAPAYVEAALGAWDDEIVFAAPCKLGPDEWGLIASCDGDVLYFDPEHVMDFDFAA